MLLIFPVNTHGLFLWKVKKVLQLLMLLKNFQTDLIGNKTKYGYIKTVNFCIRSIKPKLQDNNTKIFSIHNEGKSVIAERFIRTLKNQNL